MVTEAQKKATTKWENKAYKKICLRLPATEGISALYDKITIEAGKTGKSLNGYIIEAIEEKIARDQADQQAKK